MKYKEESVYDMVCNRFDELVLDQPLSLMEELQVLEKNRISNALQACNGNRTKAASDLGIGRTLLIHKIKKYKLD